MDNGTVNSEQQNSAPDPGPADPDRSAGATEAPVAKRRAGLLLVVAALSYGVDVVTKVLATAGLEGGEPVRILGGAVYLQLLRNPYAAFGMSFGGTWVLTVVAALVVVGILWFARRLRSAGWAVGLGLILAGALGNLTDRIFRAPGAFRGHVVDFVSVFAPNGEFFPVFNAADSAITVGAVLIVLLTALGREYDGTRTGKQRGGRSHPRTAGDGAGAAGEDRA
ncbi:signal peptidase II [Saccharomonospora halophila]|uniref:signal peptidase II n=1 Tax=Saccharomonospora halophila TaxID=129922 RepID=UPI0012F88DB7|nr:signal peptidase II [Saccharomonospora halophila]